MGAQAGIRYFDNRVIDPQIPALLGEALDPYGPDSRSEVVLPGIAMVHRGLHVTLEDSRESQPFVSPHGNVMTWDGRLDNRGDLLLQLSQELDPHSPDVAVAMTVYERWGVEGFEKLIGDWSLVIWHSDRQEIVMASDFMGVRPLHYYVSPRSISWATTLEALVRLHNLYDELEPRFLAGYLASLRVDRLTPYKGVLTVKSAHSMTFLQSGRLKIKRLWTCPGNEIRYRQTSEYEEHLRTVFVGGVKDRLRSARPVWAHLSGGLDSSSIVCAADLLIRQGRVSAPELATVSFVTDGTPEMDESRFIQCVEDQLGCRGRHIQFHLTLDQVDYRRYWIRPDQPYYSELQAFELMQRGGGRLLLSGIGGDSIMGNVRNDLGEVSLLLRQMRPLAVVTRARESALAAQCPIWQMLYIATTELFPTRFVARRMLSRVFHSPDHSLSFTPKNVAAAFLLTPPMAAWWSEAWMDMFEDVIKASDISHRSAASEILMMSRRRQPQAPSDEPLTLTSHPFLDRRVVEYMLSIPTGIVAPPGKPRGLMRSAFAPFLPSRIVGRFGKALPVPYETKKAEEKLAAILRMPTALRILRYDFVDPILVVGHLNHLQNTGNQSEVCRKLLKLEGWLEYREERIAQLRHDALIAAQ